MRKPTRVLYDQKKAWSNAGKATIQVPRDRYINEIMLRCSAVYDTAGSATKAQDGVLNLISLISLKRNGHVIRSYKPARKWYTIPLDLGTKPEFVDVTTSAASGKTASFVFPIIARLNARDQNDVSALIAAHLMSSLELEITFGATGAFGTNQTIVSGEVVVTLKENELTSKEEALAYGRTGKDVIRAGSRLLEITESEVEKTIDAAYSEFRFGVDLPTGSLLRRSYLFVTRAGARDDTQVTDYRIRRVKSPQATYEETDWASSQVRDLQEYAFPAPIEGNRYLTGFTVLDYTDYGGLRLQEAENGEYQIGMTTIAPSGTTNVVLLHEQLSPIAIKAA